MSWVTGYLPGWRPAVKVFVPVLAGLVAGELAGLAGVRFFSSGVRGFALCPVASGGLSCARFPGPCRPRPHAGRGPRGARAVSAWLFKEDAHG
jgi:hypothetical protein